MIHNSFPEHLDFSIHIGMGMLQKLFLILITTVLYIPAQNASAEHLTIVFQKQKDPARLQPEADQLAALLADKLGQEVKARIPGDYASAVQALVSQNADLVYLDSVGFLLAQRDGGAKILLVEKRADSSGKMRTDYDSVFVVAKDSRLSSFEDLLKHAAQLNVVFTSPTSTSGYLFPYKRFVEAGLIKAGQDVKQVFKSVRFAGSYGQALEEVAAGRADVSAVSNYAIEGQLAASHVGQETSDKLRILARTPGVPTHVIAVRADLSDDLALKAKHAILAVSQEAPALFKDIYGASEFVEVESSSHVQASAQALSLLGISAATFAAKK